MNSFTRSLFRSSSTALSSRTIVSKRASTIAPCCCASSILPSSTSRSFSSTSRLSHRSFSSTSRLSQQSTATADQFVNIIQADAARALVSIKTLTPSAGFTLTDGLVVASPMIILDGVVFLWDVGPPNAQNMSWDGWNIEKLRIFELVTPRPEILLVGTGKQGIFPPPAFKKYLNGLGIQVDVLDSVGSGSVLLSFGYAPDKASVNNPQRNACATYNLLSEEGRRVAAAMYPLSELSARTGVIAPKKP